MENQYFINESQNLIKLCTYIHFINLNIVKRETKMIDEMSSVIAFKKIPTVHEKSNICPQTLKHIFSSFRHL